MRALIAALAEGSAQPVPGARGEERLLEQRAAMERFLAGIERRAFLMARLAVRNEDDALDIVQDAMFRLVRHYAGAPAEEWPLLFFRILRNRITDHQRRGLVRRRLTAWFAGSDEDGDRDPIASVPAPAAEEPPSQAAAAEILTALQAAIAQLPARQQEAFLLRTLEGLDVAATAAAMRCSQGSVKTHYSRAVRSLRKILGEHWP